MGCEHDTVSISKMDWDYAWETVSEDLCSLYFKFLCFHYLISKFIFIR
jgi:hypothetical protein